MYAPLLDESIPINLDLLDNCVQTFYRDGNKECSDVCISVQNRSDVSSIILEVLQSERSYYLKVFVLLIFSEFANLKWDTLPPEYKAELRDFISSYITMLASGQDKTIPPDKSPQVLRYADNVLINILKYEWPTAWPNFIPDILQAAEASPDMCANCFFILQGLAQDFNDFSEGNILTTTRQGEMSSTFHEQFHLIIPMLETALQSTDNPNLVNAALSSLKLFIGAIDQSILSENKIFGIICESLLPDVRFTINCIAVFGEVVSRSTMFPNLTELTIQLFNASAQSLSQFFPVPSSETQFDIYSLELPDPANFIHIFTSSMSSFIKPYQSTLETEPAAESYLVVLQWLFNVTQNAKSDSDDFSTCINMWHSIGRNVYTDMSNTVPPIYLEIFPALRRLCISRMISPTEVIYIVDDTGFHSQKNAIQSQHSITYINMRELLVYLTNIDQEDMLNALLEKITEISGSPEIDSINSFCWAAGCLGAGAIEPAAECQIFVSLLDCFLSMFASIEQPLIQATIACGILYICSQYGRILENNRDLLKVVMGKCFEFMQEKEIPELQESAIDAMKKIVRRCAYCIVEKHEGEESSLFEAMLSDSETILQALRLDDVIEMYEVYAILIPCLSGDTDKEQVLVGISGILNQKMAELVGNLQPFDENWYESFNFVIQCNIRLSKYLGNIYIAQFEQIFPQFLQIYKFSAEAIGEVPPGSPQYPILANIKKLILELITIVTNLINKQDFLLNTIYPVAMEYFLPEYAQNENCRSPGILNLFGSLTAKIPGEITQNLPVILDSLFSPTMQYLEDYSENYEYWVSFSIFLSYLVSRIPQFLTELSKEKLDFFINSLKLCCSHPEVEIYERSLQAFMDMLSAFDNITTIQFTNDFMACYGFNLLNFTMELMTDSIHKNAFNELMGLTRKLVSTSYIKSKKVEVFNMLTTMYSNRPPAEIGELVEELIQASGNYFQFKNTLRNFLIVSNKYAHNDPALYQMEKEETEKLLQEKSDVPGLLTDSKEIKDNIQQLMNLAANFSFPK